MTEQRAVIFLRNIQKFILAVEGMLIDVISVCVPYLTPLLPSYLTFRHLTEILGFPFWIGLTSALVVELLGLAAINTSLSFWAYNQEEKRTRAPLALAIVTALFYLLVVQVVVVVLDDSPFTHRLAKGLLSSLSLAGALVIALRASHSKRLTEIEQAKQNRKNERQNRKVSHDTLHDVGKILQDGQSILPSKKLDWRTLPQIEKVRVALMAKSELIQEFGLNERTARNWQTLAGKNGFYHKKI